MKKLLMISALTTLAVVIAGPASFMYLKAAEQKLVQDQKEKKADPTAKERENTGDLDLENRDFDIDEREDKRLDKELEIEKQEYVSLRKKKDKFIFHMGFGIGGIGYTVVGGPRSPDRGLYRVGFITSTFPIGFRGGLDALFFINKNNCLTLGAFYEQRKVQLKINYIPLSAAILQTDQLFNMYYLPMQRFFSRTTVDLNYITIPVTYRYYFKDEFYIGLGFDIAVFFLGKANYSIFLFKSSLNMKKMLAPVDFDAKVLFGFIMNKVFIELALGGGILELDRMRGDRHSIYLTATIGYRI